MSLLLRRLGLMLIVAGSFTIGVVSRDITPAVGADEAAPAAKPAAVAKNKPQQVILFRKGRIMPLIFQRGPTEPNYPAKANITKLTVTFTPSAGLPESWTVLDYKTSGKRLSLLVVTGNLQAPSPVTGRRDLDGEPPPADPVPVGPGEIDVCIESNLPEQCDTAPGSETDQDPCTP